MPELPEVEQFRWLLLPLVSTASGPNACLSIECPSPTPPRSFPTMDELDSLQEYRVTGVKRRGKLLRVELKYAKKSKRETHQDQELHLYLHMGMTGRISSEDKVPSLESLSGEDSYPPPHTHLVMKANGHEAAFSDPRRFGKVCLCVPSENQFDDLAPDAMDDPGTLDGIVGQRKGIKALLLDQKAAVSGVGNWIADEVLYQSDMHPDQTYLTTAEKDVVKNNLHSILTTAVRCLKEGKDFPNDWIFHRRWDKSASKGATIKDAKGRKISWLQSGGRSSAVVLSVQKLRSRKMSEERKSDASCSSKEDVYPDSPLSDKGGKPAGRSSSKKKRKTTADQGKAVKSSTSRSDRRK